MTRIIKTATKGHWYDLWSDPPFFRYYFPRENLRLVPYADGFGILRHQGFGRWKGRTISWADVERVDGDRRPTLGVEIADWTILLPRKEAVVLDDRMPGFEDVINEFGNRWPEIKARWKLIYTGPSDQEEYRTIWLRPEEKVY